VTAVRAWVEQTLYGGEVVMDSAVVRGQLEVQAKPLHGQPHEAGDEVAYDDARRPGEQDNQQRP
jgi:hypothetical protein